MSVSIDSTPSGLDLTPPVVGEVEESFIGSGQRNQHVSLHPDCLSLAVVIISFTGGEILDLLRVEHILKRKGNIILHITLISSSLLEAFGKRPTRRCKLHN